MDGGKNENRQRPLIELLEFASPPAEASEEYEYWRVGWSHI
jgi:hypothetical protein